jgi:thymidylate synthase
MKEYAYLAHPDYKYFGLLDDIMQFGEERKDRTGTGTVSLFGLHTRYDLTMGFPLLTTKKLHIPSIVHELLWFLKGSTNVKELQDVGVKIWNADYERWLKETGKEDDGELGPIYGKQWRDWQGLTFHKGEDTECYVDQIKWLIKELRNNPTGRRHIVNAWNVSQLDDMALPPCHIMFQAYVSNDGGLSLQMYQRSADMFLGVPFNIASYALLTHMIAHVTGLYAKEFIHVIGDGHCYLNHLKQIEEQMKREPRELPTLWLNPEVKNIDDFTFEDIRFDNYNPHPPIKGKVSVG